MANCIECTKFIEKTAWSKKRKFCSKECNIKNYNKRIGKMKSLNLPSGTIGTISELEVGIELLRRGYEVYKPLTPNCSGDLLAEKNGVFKKIEVRTGMRNEITGKISYGKLNIKAPILAVFLAKTKEIIYIGEIS